MAADRQFPEVSGPHPVLAHCSSEVEADAILALLRRAGIAGIRLDREEASLRLGAPEREGVSIVVYREDYARARVLLAEALPDLAKPGGEERA